MFCADAVEVFIVIGMEVGKGNVCKRPLLHTVPWWVQGKGMVSEESDLFGELHVRVDRSHTETILFQHGLKKSQSHGGELDFRIGHRDEANVDHDYRCEELRFGIVLTTRLINRFLFTE